MTGELVAIDNTLMIIAGSLFWLAIAQTVFLYAIFIKLRQLTFLRKDERNNRQQESDSIKDRVKDH